MKSWKTTIGGALSSAGKGLLGIGMEPQLSGQPSKLLTQIAIAGFLLDIAGGFCAHLWAADENMVIQMLKKTGTDTSMLEK